MIGGGWRVGGGMVSRLQHVYSAPLFETCAIVLTKLLRGCVRVVCAVRGLDHQMPTGPWKELCDMLHLNPEKGTATPWFLKHVYGEEPPAGTVLQARDSLLNADGDPASVLSAVPLPYSVVRTSLPWLSQSCKGVLCKQMPLDQLIWWYEELKVSGLSPFIYVYVAGPWHPCSFSGL